ncbi:MAG: hypothetical protein KDC53_19755 [Saprospiraceae bacterium]|nr:hypothetical protein [Saprospiraceae bacterium]
MSTLGNISNQICAYPYKLIWAAIPVILAFAFFGMNDSIDLILHDTYLVIGIFHVGVSISFLLFLLGGIYWQLRNRNMTCWLTVLHVLITLFTLIPTMVLLMVCAKVPLIADGWLMVLIVLFFIGIFSQFALVWNIFQSRANF